MSQHTGQNFAVDKNAPAKKEFTEEFDFEESNKKLDLAKVAAEMIEQQEHNVADKVEGTETVLPKAAYDKAKDFFDEISCESLERRSAGGQPKRMDREMREKQKQLNLETFGSMSVMDRDRGYGQGQSYNPRRGYDNMGGGQNWDTNRGRGDYY